MFCLHWCCRCRWIFRKIKEYLSFDANNLLYEKNQLLFLPGLNWENAPARVSWWEARRELPELCMGLAGWACFTAWERDWLVIPGICQGHLATKICLLLKHQHQWCGAALWGLGLNWMSPTAARARSEEGGSSSLQSAHMLLFFTVESVPLKDKVVKCAAFWHWSTKSGNGKWKSVQSGDRDKAVWKDSIHRAELELNSLGTALPSPAALRGFASTAVPVAAGREMHTELYRDGYTHHLHCLAKDYN